MAEKSSITLVWPAFATAMQQINYSTLPKKFKRLLNKSHFTASEASCEQTLIQLFNAITIEETDLPMAKLRNPDRSSLCADPCYLHADRDRLLLFPIDDLTMQEASDLMDSVQPLLNDFDAQLILNDLNHWSIRLENLPDITFTAMPSLIGKSVASALPKGKEQNAWLRLINEIQMVLFEHPINQQRQTQGKLPVNSIWFWGNANWQPKTDFWSDCYGDIALLKLLSATNSTRSHSWSQWNIENSMTGKQLIVLPKLDFQNDWQRRIEQFEIEEFLPLVKKLRRYQIQQLRLIIPEHGEFQWRCWDIWKPW